MSWLTPEWVQAIAVAVAGFAAWRGFGAWRHELAGKKRYELAEETLALFYEALDEIQAMRGGPIPEDEEPEGPDFTRIVGGPLASRLDALQLQDEARRALFAKLRAHRFRYMATFGPEHSAPFTTFNAVTGQVRAFAKHLRKLPDPKTEKDFARLEKLQTVRYLSGDDDAIENRLAKALAQIEEVCRKELEAKRTWWEWWREWAKPPDL